MTKFMKKNLQILLLFISTSFVSCNSADNIVPISDMNKDFPTAEKLEFKPFNKYDIYGGRGIVDDSVLWYFCDDDGSFGYCYDLNTGEKLSTIITKGRALNELSRLDVPEFSGDSIHFYDEKRAVRSVKTFAKRDIISNIPLGERKFSVITLPDSVYATQMTKLSNGSILAKISSTPEFSIRKQDEKDDLDNRSAVVFHNNEISYFEAINYDSFDIKVVPGRSDRAPSSPREQIKIAYTSGRIGVKDNEVAVFTLEFQFILYTFDLKKGKIIKEKRYTEMQGGEIFPTNEMKQRISDVIHNDKYILCFVDGFLSKEDKELKQSKSAIFVFDWDLNPIKRFDLPEGRYNYYTISNDWRSVYLYVETEEGLTLQKADLNL